MDGMIYVAVGGASTALYTQAILANNLANVNTVGYRADHVEFVSQEVGDDSELNTRIYAGGAKLGTNFKPGSSISTGRDLDIALSGDGLIAVQDKDGKEVYTRNGNFHIDENGILKTSSNQKVIGGGGEIIIPPSLKIDIGNDGTISIIPLEGNSDKAVEIDRIKFVKPQHNEIEKGQDGLFRAMSGKEADVDLDVRCAAGFLESSNVNAVEAITQMIAIARQFEANLKLLDVARENEHENAKIISTI